MDQDWLDEQLAIRDRSRGKRVEIYSTLIVPLQEPEAVPAYQVLEKIEEASE